jgi:hypothetical protein
MKTFKLIVTANENCMKILRYLQKCINDINTMGVRVQIEKISRKEFDEDMVEMLRRKGITRLPVLLAPDGASFIGVGKITDLFERNLKSQKTGARVAPAGGGESGGGGNAELGSNPALTDFWMSEMYGGKDDNGRLIPKKDQDEGDDERNDMDAKMRNYQSRVPRHRGGGAQPELNIEAPERPRRRRGGAPPPQDNIAPMEDYDGDDGLEYDIPSSTPGTPIRPPKYTPSDEGGEDVDQKMLSAWLDNNPGEF